MQVHSRFLCTVCISYDFFACCYETTSDSSAPHFEIDVLLVWKYEYLLHFEANSALSEYVWYSRSNDTFLGNSIVLIGLMIFKRLRGEIDFASLCLKSLHSSFSSIIPPSECNHTQFPSRSSLVLCFSYLVFYVGCFGNVGRFVHCCWPFCHEQSVEISRFTLYAAFGENI